MIRLFAGLGNPGQRYTKNRHNLGFRVIDQLAKLSLVDWQEKKQFMCGSFWFEGNRTWLLKPLTYMNLSGEIIAPFARKKGFTPQEILVIHDEAALPLGQLRLKPQGGDGGHNGLSSIIVALNDDSFPRLRLGINQPPPRIDLASYVLANFMVEEEAIVEGMVNEAADVCHKILADGLAKVMTTTNERKSDPV